MSYERNTESPDLPRSLRILAGVCALGVAGATFGLLWYQIVSDFKWSSAPQDSITVYVEPLDPSPWTPQQRIDRAFQCLNIVKRGGRCDD